MCTKIPSIAWTESAMPFVLCSHSPSYMIIICSLFFICVLFSLELSQSKGYFCSLFRIELGLLHYQDGLFALCSVRVQRAMCFALNAIFKQFVFFCLYHFAHVHEQLIAWVHFAFSFLRTILLSRVYSVR